LKYKVTTDDGYILTLFRILGKISDYSYYDNINNKKPVLLCHGIFQDSLGFIQSGVEGKN
jgi:hypothetical protein